VTPTKNGKLLLESKMTLSEGIQLKKNKPTEIIKFYTQKLLNCATNDLEIAHFLHQPY
jgi:hypothetical protein